MAGRNCSNFVGSSSALKKELFAHFSGFLANCLGCLGFVTGIPRVQFSHTVPVPAKTVPMAGTGTHQPVVFAVCYETRGIPFTHGYLQLFLFKYTYLNKYMDETEPPGLGFMWLSVEKSQKKWERE